jgi:hypothetical protein
VQQHLGRLDGVAKVDVNLLDGKVVIHPKEDGRFDPSSVLKATYDSGVSLAEMTLTANGRLTKTTKGLQFEVKPNLSFPVKAGDFTEKADALAAGGKDVRLRGRLYKKPPGKQKPESEPLTFEILEVLS